VRESQEAAVDMEAQIRLVEVGWGGEDPAYHEFFAARFMPDATREKREAMVELQRASTSGANAARALRAMGGIDVRESASRVRCPTLIMHCDRDRVVPFEEGRLLATLIPGARLVAFDSRNHIPIEQDPAWEAFFEELNAFVPSDRSPPASGSAAPLARLTAREAEILERVAQGLDNAQIAARLGLSEKTVRNYVTQIFDKIEVENRAQAIVRAREAGLGRTSGRGSGD
jgi:DNA-binding CsgD family transcriptional regulator